MKGIFIEGVLLQDCRKDILIEGNRIKKIADKIDLGLAGASYKKIDGRKKAMIPGLVNMHTHSAMTLMRGISEDSHLQYWLNSIWKIEPRLDEELIYWGTKLACLEMLKTGTTCFNDQYWMIDTAVRAIAEMGLRSVNPFVFLDMNDTSKDAALKEKCIAMFEKSQHWNACNRFAVGIHAPYSVSEELMVWASAFARKHDLLVHIHLSETEQENRESVQKHGMTPTRYLEKLGILGPEVIAAHCVWIDDADIEILARNDVKIVHNINSNLKLASGYKFKYNEFRKAGLTVCLGTDGCASSNNLDMIETMKTTALVQKAWRKDPTAMPLPDLLDMATVNGARSLRLDAGTVAEGALADLVLVDIDNYAFTPHIHFLANLVYSANSSCVDTVICNGQVLMEGRKVRGEEEILNQVNRIYKRLME